MPLAVMERRLAVAADWDDFVWHMKVPELMGPVPVLYPTPARPRRGPVGQKKKKKKKKKKEAKACRNGARLTPQPTHAAYSCL